MRARGTRLDSAPPILCQEITKSQQCHNVTHESSGHTRGMVTATANNAMQGDDGIAKMSLYNIKACCSEKYFRDDISNDVPTFSSVSQKPIH